MLKGRLGLDTARIPHKDRHGLMWLSKGQMWVQDGTLRFTGTKDSVPGAGEFEIPVQMVSCFLMGPGTSITHDSMRICARMGTGIVFVGEDGVRMYASMPPGPDNSSVARSQVRHWTNPETRIQTVRKMYEWRMGVVLEGTDMNSLRGIEGQRAKETYKNIASRYGLIWQKRDYDRSNPSSNDDINMAINHASVAVTAAAEIAVAAVGAIPQIGFIHEDPGMSFSLDIADLYRDDVTLPAAFSSVRQHRDRGGELERIVRVNTGTMLRNKKIIPTMIDRIKELFKEEKT